MGFRFCLLFGNVGEDEVAVKARNAELSERSGASGDENSEHPIEVIRLAPTAPFLNVNLLPAIGTHNSSAP